MQETDRTPGDKLEAKIDEVAAESSYWFARHSKSAIFLIFALAAVGLYEVFTIPVSVFPSTDFPRIIIGVDNGVMPIDQMMVTITRPLEEAVNSVEGLESVQSVTSRGSAEIDLFFNWNVDMFQTLQRVDSALARVQATLPPTAKIDTHRLSFASFPILGYSLTSDKIPQTQLWEIATYDIKPRLNRLNGVATVLVQGGDQPEFELTADPSKLLRARVTISDVLDAVKKTNLIDSPGLLEHNHQLFLGLISAQVHTPEEIQNIVVKNTGDIPVRLGDLGPVAPSVAPVYTVVTANGKPAVLLSINRQPTSNTVSVADEVHNEIALLQKGLPPGVDLRVYYDQSNIVSASIASVRDAILVGLILASIILVVFLHDWGSSIIAGLVIPVTVLVTFIAMKVLGESFNLMTMGGLAAAVGLVIDDAIVVVENIVLHRDAGEDRLEAIHGALQEITVPLIGSTVTPVVVFLPLITMTGVTGSFFRALAVTMSVSLFTSLALALIWTPNLSLYFLRRKTGPSAEPEVAKLAAADAHHYSADSSVEMRRLMAAEDASMKGFFGKVITFYEGWVRRALEHPAVLLVLCLVLVGVSYLCYRSLGTDLLPAMDEGGFIIDYVMPPGSSLQETNRVVSHMEQIVRSTPEVENTSRRTGEQLGLATVTEANTGDISAKLKQKRGRSIDEIMSEIRSKIHRAEPSIDIDFIQVLQDMIGDLTGGPKPIQINMFAPNGGLLAQWAPQVADAISKIEIGGRKPVVVDVANGIDNTTSGPAVVFQVNPATAARAGFSPEEVSIDAAAMLEGKPTITPVVVNDHLYTLRVRFPKENRATLEAMSNTMLISSTGSTATLGSLATVTELPGQTEITRVNLQRDVSVSARLEGVDLGTGIKAVQKAVEELKVPSSIRIEYGGTFREQQKSFHDLVIVLVLALVLVFLVLLFEFRQFAAPVAILTSAVLSTSGVFFALLITGITFNISSFMGLIMVIGIVAKNGILLLDADHKFRSAGFPAEEAMVQAGRRRLRPIVMTALAAMAGMLPLSLAVGAGSQMLQPLAIAVIGGILISMVLSLVVTPAIQYYLTRKEIKTF